MDYQSGHVLTLANSIIGVGVLAMPYCFKQCGILLSIVMLMVSSVISRLSCHFLLKSAINSRRKTFEILALHIFGSLGKFIIEIGIIGFLLGTCIAFFVIMGDLTPDIISELTGIESSSTLRIFTLVALTLFCILPLGLLRNVESLNGVSKATIGFYCCLVLKVVVEALPHMFTGDWTSGVTWWRPEGILQCLPIFSMALFCQTQLFEIVEVLPNLSLDKMNSLVRVAVTICTWVYIFVGSFGYIAFFKKPFTGNILLSFEPSITSDIMKMGFVLSVAFSFPLVIFPCRASLYSLFYRGVYSLHEGSACNYIPEGRFKVITFCIVFVSLIIGILIPSIEMVLGLLGSTIGVLICILFPVACFIRISPKNTNERILAQIMLFVGVMVMVLGTYANLNMINKEISKNIYTVAPMKSNVDILINSKEKIDDMKNPVIPDKLTVNEPFAQEEPKVDAKIEHKENEQLKEIRHEPPQPEEPLDSLIADSARLDKNSKEKAEQVDEKKPIQAQEAIVKEGVEVEVLKNDIQPDRIEETGKVTEKMSDPEVHPPIQPIAVNLNKKLIQERDTKENNFPKDKAQVIGNVTLNKNHTRKAISPTVDEIDGEAIKKEDTELKAQGVDENNNQKEVGNAELLESIKQQKHFQKEIVEQQKLLLRVIQNQQESLLQKDINRVNEERVKAVHQIETIARHAIEEISGKKAIGENSLNNTLKSQKVDDKSSNVATLNSPAVQADISSVTLLNDKNKSKVLPYEGRNQPVPMVIALSQNISLYPPKLNNSAVIPNSKTGESAISKEDKLSVVDDEVKVQNVKLTIAEKPKAIETQKIDVVTSASSPKSDDLGEIKKVVEIDEIPVEQLPLLPVDDGLRERASGLRRKRDVNYDDSTDVEDGHVFVHSNVKRTDYNHSCVDSERNVQASEREEK